MRPARRVVSEPSVETHGYEDLKLPSEASEMSLFTVQLQSHVFDAYADQQRAKKNRLGVDDLSVFSTGDDEDFGW